MFNKGVRIMGALWSNQDHFSPFLQRRVGKKRRGQGSSSCGKDTELVNGTSNSFPVKAIKTNIWERLSAPKLDVKRSSNMAQRTNRKEQKRATGTE